jgi:2-amino-4-hydroxy-6-hydroxymethyldihydropteridine diphosphokinase
MDGKYLLLGSNLGNRLANLQRAIKLLKQKGIFTERTSSVYESEPWGIHEQDWFLNAVLEIESSLGPEQLLQSLLDVEKTMGRVRQIKWGPRLIDIDILYMDDHISNSDMLRLPHPGIPGRRFTLMPLVELIPDKKHPLSGATQVELLVQCEDPLKCVKSEMILEK